MNGLVFINIPQTLNFAEAETGQMRLHLAKIPFQLNFYLSSALWDIPKPSIYCEA